MATGLWKVWAMKVDSPPLFFSALSVSRIIASSGDAPLCMTLAKSVASTTLSTSKTSQPTGISSTEAVLAMCHPLWNL
jgi:hypothetical protein